jgi:hypothetical protein
MSEIVPGDVVVTRDLTAPVYRDKNPNLTPAGYIYSNVQALVLSVVNVQTVTRNVTWAMVLYDDSISWIPTYYVMRYKERHEKA